MSVTATAFPTQMALLVPAAPSLPFIDRSLGELQPTAAIGGSEHVHCTSQTVSVEWTAGGINTTMLSTQRAKDNVWFAAELSKLIGGVLAGYWVLFQFGALQQAATADAELTKLRLGNERTEQDLQATRPALEVSISEVRAERGDNGWFMLSTVSLTNKGSRDALVNFKSPPFFASQLHFSAGSPQESPTGRRIPAPAPVEHLVLRAGITQTLPFVVFVDEPGLYLLAFQVGAAVEDAAALTKRLMIAPASNFIWVARRHLRVADE